MQLKVRNINEKSSPDDVDCPFVKFNTPGDVGPSYSFVLFSEKPFI